MKSSLKILNNLFLYFVRKKNYSRLLGINRGYQKLKSTDNLGLIDDLKNKLTHTKLFNSSLSRFLNLNSNEIIFEQSVRQYLLKRYASTEFNREILKSFSSDLSRFTQPIPNVWAEVLNNNGVRVNFTICQLLWYFELFKFSFFGIFEVFKQNISSIKYLFVDKIYNRNFIYFDSLNLGNIPQKTETYQYGIFSWYLNKYGKGDLDFIAHSVNTEESILLNNEIRIKYLNQPFAPILSVYRILIFGFKSIFLYFISIYYLLIGNWWYLVLLREIILSEVVKINQGEGLAKKYYFNNSNWIYRPLWTYVAQNFGSEVIFYFYSTNIERFYKFNKTPIVVNSWEVITWPKILVWDEYQLQFLTNNVLCKNLKYDIIGPFEFQASNAKISIVDNSIAVFDVQPVRDTYYQSLGLDQEYYVPEVTNSFLSDVIESVDSLKFSIAFKRKRSIGKLAHYKYLNEINRISKEYDFLNIDPSIPAELIIAKAKAVISMPFTSTALVGRHLGKPSIFYDPSGLVEKDDPAAHGIRVINNKADLKDWLSKI